MKIKFFIIILLFAIPFKLQAAQAKPVKVFDFSGNLIDTIELQNYNWTKTGDIKVFDLGADGVPEIILSAPAGEQPYLKIYRLDGSLIKELLIYPKSYLGGVNFEVADLDNDEKPEIITGATFSGGPHVIILNNLGETIRSFFAFDIEDKGGVNVAAGNLYDNALPEIIVSSNDHNYVRIFDRFGKILNGFELANGFKNGQKITSFDLGQDGVNEIITYANSGDKPYLNLYQNNGQPINSFLVYNENFTGGFNFDHQNYKLFLGAGFGAGPHLKIVDGYASAVSQFFTAESVFLGGVKLSVFDDKIYVMPEQFPTAEKSEAKYILIDISEQKLKTFENGFMIGDYPVSSGTYSYPTPTGKFSILNKSPLQYSYTYGLYMPFWMNFYRNFGIHELPYWPSGYREGENHLGARASHGCVRLGIGSAETVYNWTELGAKVYIQD